MRPTYNPVGTCIFCRDFVRSYAKGELTDEHIIAYSIGGQEELPQATCKAHQDVTAKLDEHIARDMLKVYRHAYGLPSRSGFDARPFYKIPVTNQVTGITFFQTVPVAEVPGLYVSPHLITPGILVGAPAVPLRMGHICHHASDGKLAEFTRMLPGGASASWTSGKIVLKDFARMLAKVGHTYATAEIGHGNFIPTLLDVIDDKSENPFHFVGGFEPYEAQEGHPLSLRDEVRDGVRYWVVSISLMSLPAMPRFQVVAGIALDPSPFPERSKAH
jgi:hypothetical protein